MEEKEKLLSKYKANSYSPADLEQIEQLLLNGSLSITDLEDVKEFTQTDSEEPDSKSLRSMDQKFYAMLESKVVTPHKNKLMKWNVLLSALVLLLTGLCLFQMIQSKEVKKEATTSTSQHLASIFHDNDMVEDRIHLVSNLSKQEQLKDELLEVLLYHLISDESTNVRLASLNTLKGYMKSPQVRQGLINAIPFQDSPIVLMYINEALTLNGHALSKEDFTTRVNMNTRPAFKQSLKSISVQ